MRCRYAAMVSKISSTVMRHTKGCGCSLRLSIQLSVQPRRSATPGGARPFLMSGRSAVGAVRAVRMEANGADRHSGLGGVPRRRRTNPDTHEDLAPEQPVGLHTPRAAAAPVAAPGVPRRLGGPPRNARRSCPTRAAAASTPASCDIPTPPGRGSRDAGRHAPERNRTRTPGTPAASQPTRPPQPTRSACPPPPRAHGPGADAAAPAQHRKPSRPSWIADMYITDPSRAPTPTQEPSTTPLPTNPRRLKILPPNSLPACRHPAPPPH